MSKTLIAQKVEWNWVREKHQGQWHQPHQQAGHRTVSNSGQVTQTNPGNGRASTQDGRVHRHRFYCWLQFFLAQFNDYNMRDTAIIVSGLPASGKTTVGKTVAKRLDIPFLDKDDILEELFERKGIGDQSWRTQLSVESNSIFECRAKLSEQIVLISHWQQSLILQSGTPTNWLDNSYYKIVEIYCKCEPDTAANRFLARSRHKGHLDNMRSFENVLSWMLDIEAGYPLHIGTLIDIETDREPDYSSLINQLNHIINS